MGDLIDMLPARQRHFKLESGHHGDLWLDLELLCLNPEPIQRFAAQFASRLSKHDVQGVCGPLVEGAFVALMVISELRVPFTYSERFVEPGTGSLYPCAYRAHAPCARWFVGSAWRLSTRSIPLSIEATPRMKDEKSHNPDQYMADFRQILAQGKKRLGLLLGAGTAASIRVDDQPLVPTIPNLTKLVCEKIEPQYRAVLIHLIGEDGTTRNIEEVLTKVRSRADVLGNYQMDGLDGSGYGALADAICRTIGAVVDVRLPAQPNPYTELAGWIGGVSRDHAIEIFTPNYDLLLEEAFERLHMPYFDGFCGSREPFFDPASVLSPGMPPRWVRLWKIHGSLGWSKNEVGEITRTTSRSATDLIYPTHLKYDQTRKLPYTAFIERLRTFLISPDSLFLISGFSFLDVHLVAVIEEALSANAASAAIAFQFRSLAEEPNAVTLAERRSNLSVYCPDGAVVGCVKANWRPLQLRHREWEGIRASYWRESEGGAEATFRLGDFVEFAKHLALTRADYLRAPSIVREEDAQEGVS